MPNIARDMELVRNLTGFMTLDYIGLDDGSRLGVTYAALFHDRVGKMVLDGSLRIEQFSRADVF